MASSTDSIGKARTSPASINARSAETQKTNTSSAVVDDSAVQKKESPLDRLSTKFSLAASKGLNALTESDRRGKAAEDATTGKLDAIKRLQTAQEQGDKKEIKKAEQAVEQASRNERRVAAKLQQNPEQPASTRVFLGNQQVAKVEPQQFKISAPTEKLDTNDPKALERERERLETQKKTLEKQRAANTEQRQSLDSAIKKGTEQVRSIESNISGIQSRENGSQDLANSIATRIREDQGLARAASLGSGGPRPEIASQLLRV